MMIKTMLEAKQRDFQISAHVHGLTLDRLAQELREVLAPHNTKDSETHHEELSSSYKWDADLSSPNHTREIERRGIPRLTGQTTLGDLRYRWISVFPVTGASEGHYVHVDLIWQHKGAEGRIPLFLLKTFAGTEAAITLAGVLCRALGV